MANIYHTLLCDWSSRLLGRGDVLVQMREGGEVLVVVGGGGGGSWQRHKKGGGVGGSHHNVNVFMQVLAGGGELGRCSKLKVPQLVLHSAERIATQSMRNPLFVKETPPLSFKQQGKKEGNMGTATYLLWYSVNCRGDVKTKQNSSKHKSDSLFMNITLCLKKIGKKKIDGDWRRKAELRWKRKYCLERWAWNSWQKGLKKEETLTALGSQQRSTLISPSTALRQRNKSRQSGSTPVAVAFPSPTRILEECSTIHLPPALFFF